jgi:hypothetical protein
MNEEMSPNLQGGVWTLAVVRDGVTASNLVKDGQPQFKYEVQHFNCDDM